MSLFGSLLPLKSREPILVSLALYSGKGPVVIMSAGVGFTLSIRTVSQFMCLFFFRVAAGVASVNKLQINYMYIGTCMSRVLQAASV